MHSPFMQNSPWFASQAWKPGLAPTYSGALFDIGYFGLPTLAGLPTGTYRVRFTPYDGDHSPQYYAGKATLATADPVTVTVGAVTPGIDVELQAQSKLTGVVTNTGGVRLPNVDVQVFDSGGATVRADATDGAGRYAVTGLAPGQYRLRFSDADGVYTTQFYSGAATLETATPVTVSTGATTTADVQLHSLLGSIAGTVTGPGGSPAADVDVYVVSLALNTGHTATTDADGHYAVTGLAAGSYFVQFASGDGEYFLDVTRDDVPVASDTTARVDAQLQLGGKVSGTVTNAAGAAVPHLSVLLRDGAGQIAGSGFTDGAGHYDSAPVPPGSYAVEFGSLSDTDYLHQWYNGRDPGDTHDLVTVTAGVTTPEIDAVLQRGASVSGTVTDAAGVPLGGVQVRADTATASGVREAWTDTGGRYRLPGLAPGTYKIVFAGTGTGDGRYIPQYYGAASYGAATLTVAAGVDLTGVDAHLQLAGRITGDVTDLGGTPVAGIQVEALDATGDIVSWTTSDVDGHYAVGSLPAGSYRVHFTDDAFGGTYEDQYYDGVFLLSAAKPVTVAAGATVVGIGAYLGGHGQSPPSAGTGGKPGLGGASTVDAKGRLVLSLRCPGAKPCAGTLRLTAKTTTKVKGHKKVTTVTVGSAKYTVAAKGLVRIRVQLTSAGRRLLKSVKGRLRTTLTFAITPGKDTLSQSLTLRAAKKHR